MRLSLKPNCLTLIRILQALFLTTLACITGMVVIQLTCKRPVHLTLCCYRRCGHGISAAVVNSLTARPAVGDFFPDRN